MFIGDHLARRCVYDADAIALVDVTGPEPVARSYADLDAAANRTANWLRSRGVAAGDRVAFLGHDGPAVFEMFFACSKIGAVFVPLNWRLHPTEIEGLLARTGPALLVHDTAEPMAAAAAHLGAVQAMPALVPLDDARASA